MYKRFVSVSVLAATCVFAFNSLNAQTLARDNGPAEIPPSSFTASQYVDSKGCVYIRAGVDGNVNWVPRVSRTRKVVCGQTPSLGGSRTAAAAPAPARAPVQIEAAPAPVAVAPKSPAPVRATRNTVASVLAPRPVRTVASKPVVKQRIAPTMQATRTPRPSTFRQDPPRIQAAPLQAPQRRVQAQPRIVRVAPTVQAVQPRRVITNTQRTSVGSQTCRGASALSQQYIGRAGNAVRCGPQQGAFVTRAGDVKGGTFRGANGQILNTASVSPNAIVVPRHVYEQQRAVQPRKQVRVSTRTSAPRKPAAVVGKSYVQVGTFGVAANAQNTAARIQRMGLPVRIGKFTRGGKEMRIVLAGPFPSSAHVNGALRAVHNAGFRDAFARK